MMARGSVKHLTFVVLLSVVFVQILGNPAEIRSLVREWEKEEQYAGHELQDHNGLPKNEDSYLDVPELIVKYGYPVEIHNVVTEDGYILEVHRIPHGRASGSGPAADKPVVWLQHGLLCSSADWIMNTVDKALAYRLADQGYDVWMGNARGNKYSKKHLTLDPKENPREFYKFSWHEMGVYDVPAVIDYVTGHTGQEKIFWIGHSMGTTMFWVAMSEKPEYNDKILLMVALAPVGYMEHVESPIRLIAPFSTSLDWILTWLGLTEFMPSGPLMDLLGNTICHQNSPIQAVCANVVFLICGYNTEQLNKTMLPVILGHTPAGASTKSLIHYAQGINSHEFRRYDFGKAENREIYGQDTPPVYDVTKITAPVAFYWGSNDWLTGQADIYRLAEKLPNLVKITRVNHDKWNHLDFLWAIDIVPYLYGDVESFMKYFLP